jgi:GNAT superfamily N-acetyltransferase
MIEIRPTERDDIPLILRLVRELAEFEREPEAVVATEDMLCDALFGDRPAAEAVVAEHHSNPVGFALFFENFSTWTGRPGMYLEDLYVTPTARGLGIGTEILRHLAGIAVDRGYGRFEWAVLDWNEPALSFYRSMGAVGMDEWRIQRVSGEALKRLARR